MGREIRRVPANWQHPTKKETDWRTGQEEERFQPMRNRAYLDELNEWIAEHNLWEKGEHPDQKEGEDRPRYYAEWSGNPPDVEYYRPAWKPEEMTWWQVYETVSEGTPVTPPFATQDELIEYLVANGDFWDQKRRAEGKSSMPCEPWSRVSAERFVKDVGWAPSLISTPATGVMSGVEALDRLQ